MIIGAHYLTDAGDANYHNANLWSYAVFSLDVFWSQRAMLGLNHQQANKMVYNPSFTDQSLYGTFHLDIAHCVLFRGRWGSLEVTPIKPK
ncbi:hypothetical protein [Cypionkella sp. TWP1-2-1b2]|uniref:hypothetical protein n=1 Tax=Cypionkella sp. TWP1-2-1b2 TaxID=2804675 RepID=UPI003CF1EE82